MTVSETSDFQAQLKQGIPDVLPPVRPRDESVSHAPRRKQILTPEEERLALRNALRYFPQKFHAELAPEFVNELRTYGRIYMYRFRPDYKMYARPVEMYPAKSQQAAAIMMMIQNNLDPAVAQHPHELITYGGNGAVFQNWAQYLLVMKYLSEMHHHYCARCIPRPLHRGTPLHIGNAIRVIGSRRHVGRTTQSRKYSRSGKRGS